MAGQPTEDPPTTHDSPTPDPATDPRARYDYRGGTVEYPDLEADLEERVEGDVRFDSYSRELYATDASIYEVTPVGVVFPRSTADVAAVVSYCADRRIPVLPRGAGTSLAGQTVNEAVVLDFSRYMDGILDVDPDARTASAQPGVVLADLNSALADVDGAWANTDGAPAGAPHGLKFAPDPAWGDKSTLGGAIGNNSTGAHSLQYGKTDAYVEECEVVLADGTVTTLGEVPLPDLRERADPDGDTLDRVAAEVVRIADEEADAVEAAFPDLKRNVSGYNLDVLVSEANSEDNTPPTVNLARLLAGSEGTLGVVTEATVSLEPVPATKSMALLAYEDLLEAVDDVSAIVGHDPAAVELVDDVLLDLASETAEFEDVTAMLPEGTRAVLLVEFYAADDAAGREKVRRLLADRCPDALDDSAMESGATAGDAPPDATATPPAAFDALQAHADADRERFWKLRKSGLPILLSRTTDEKHASFVEDCAVPPEHLREYVAAVRDVLDDHDTYASFYAHAGPGVLHVRPLVNTKTDAGLADVAAIADEITDLVVEYGGSVSGEHGDGRARTQWNRKLYGDRVWRLLRDLKAAFDPAWLLNPGPVAGLPPEDGGGGGGEGSGGRDDTDAPTVPADVPLLTENLRFPPDYDFDAGFEPALNWDVDNGMQGMAELCHGCGGCRGSQSNTGGVMCPTYRAAEEEVLSTRGRANLLRQAASGDLPADTLTSDAFAEEVLDLCIGCKGCARDCPSEVDVAKLKAEVEHARHREEGADRRERLFAAMGRLAALGSATAPLSNWLHRIPGARALLEHALGVASEPRLPAFQRRTLAKWFAGRGPAVPADEATRRVVLLPDTFTNHVHPETGRAAVRVLEAAGVHVAVPDDVSDTGRPALSKGFVDRARDAARETVDALAPKVADGWDVVVAEPSDAVMVQSDYLDLLSGANVERVAANTYGVCEYLDVHGLDDAIEFDGGGDVDDATAENRTDARDHLVYHGHCHQKAAKRDHHAVGVLRRAGYAVDALDSGCCGMAGSFGYEAEHRSMSEAIAAVLFDQVAASDGERVVAPGASCRSQFASGVGDGSRSPLDGTTDGEPPHPVELLDAALADGDSTGE